MASLYIGFALPIGFLGVFVAIFSPDICHFGTDIFSDYLWDSGARTIFSLARGGIFLNSLSKVHKRFSNSHVATLWIFKVVLKGVIDALVPMTEVFGGSNGPSEIKSILWNSNTKC